MKPYEYFEFNNGKDLAERLKKAFEDQIGNQPYFRISATPLCPKRSLLDVEQQGLHDLMNKPPGSRPMGWSMDLSGFSIERFLAGVKRGKKDFRYYEIHETGHMEMWAPLDSNFCWRQTPEEFELQPRLYPYPVVEYPVTFLRLYRAILELFEIKDRIFVELIFENFKDYALRPYEPNAIGFMIREPKIAKEKEFYYREMLDSDFNVDTAAYDLIKHFYAWFGFDSSFIPFYDKKQKIFVFD